MLNPIANTVGNPSENTVERLGEILIALGKLDGSTDQELATDLAQSILVCHLDLIIEVLNFLGIPHEEGFFAKETDVNFYLTEGWQKRSFDNFKDKLNRDVLAFYLNHLAFESTKDPVMFQPSA